ncbi:Phage Terminase [Symmachiella macrocystis]|uniref:Phage Terminase n=1 Tax=Symmachiella macrocystis TaxID=2527985 RepID=A0A5C6AUC4_9PLAN|nr:terminase TerL endonuclease subunit [Symmachiella macrocystis]TWU03041.1 Phage Terminase [Symmachiella macrocystis]
MNNAWHERDSRGIVCPRCNDRCFITPNSKPLLRWTASNVSNETDAADNWKPSKKKSVERIDGIVAQIMALDRASTQEQFTSVYEKHGLRSL